MSKLLGGLFGALILTLVVWSLGAGALTAVSGGGFMDGALSGIKNVLAYQLWLKPTPAASSNSLISSGTGYIVWGMVLTFLFLSFRAPALRVITCASCSWKGSKSRYEKNGGCPRCGSDLYQ